MSELEVRPASLNFRYKLRNLPQETKGLGSLPALLFQTGGMSPPGKPVHQFSVGQDQWLRPVAAPMRLAQPLNKLPVFGPE